MEKENNEIHLIPSQIYYSKSAKTHGMQLMHKSHSTKLKVRHPPCFTNSAERIGKLDERLTTDDPDEGHLYKCFACFGGGVSPVGDFSRAPDTACNTWRSWL